MELLLVYRFLCQISHWTIGGFYDEVYVAGEGEEGAEMEVEDNVDAHSPVVLASTHHNEIIDIAMLGELTYIYSSSIFQFSIELTSISLFSSNNNPTRPPHLVLGQIEHVQEPAGGCCLEE